LDDKKKSLLTIVGVLAALTVTACVICRTGGGVIWGGVGATPTNSFSCNTCRWGIPITACISAPLLWSVGSIQGDIKDLKGDRSEACASTSVGSLASSSGGSSGTLAKVGAVVAGVICAIGISKGIQAHQAAQQAAESAEGVKLAAQEAATGAAQDVLKGGGTIEQAQAAAEVAANKVAGEGAAGVLAPGIGKSAADNAIKGITGELSVPAATEGTTTLDLGSLGDFPEPTETLT